MVILLPIGYLIGLAIIAAIDSPAGSADAASNPGYLIGVTIGVVAFVHGFLRPVVHSSNNT